MSPQQPFATPLAQLDDLANLGQRLTEAQETKAEAPAPNRTERILKVIRDNPGCVIFYNNISWDIYTAKDWAKRTVDVEPILSSYEDGMLYIDLITALAENVGAVIESP